MPDREVRDQTYFPSAKLRLIVRFADFGANDTPAPPKTPPQLRGGKVKPELELKTEGGAIVLRGAGATQDGGPQKQTTSDDGRTQVIEGIIPSSCSLQRNGIRIADQLTAEFKFADCPIDPRVLRSVAVEYYLGTLGQDDFERGIRGQSSGDALGEEFSGEGSPLNVVPDSWFDAAGNERSNQRFSGWVDEWAVEWPDGGEPFVRIECTDNTRLLIDQEAPPKLTVGIDDPLDKAIANYLANFPQFTGLRIEYRPAGVDPPRLKDILATTSFKSKAGPPPAGGGTNKLTVWDYLTDVAGSVGHTIRVEGITIIIQRARTLYDQSNTHRRPDDPFAGRELPSGRVLQNRTFVYGRNIREMKFARKFARFAPFNVEVRCYSGKRKKTLIARYPLKDKSAGKDAGRQTRLVPGNAADQKWVVFRVTGINDEKILRVIAQGIYESVGRNELESHFTTKDLASFGGDNSDPDVLDLQAGDTVDVEVNRDRDELSTITGAEEGIATQAEAFLTALGYGPEFARAYSNAVQNIGFQTSFRVKSIVIDWDNESEGVSIDIECVNYVEVAADRLLPQGEEITPEQSNAAAPVKVEVESGLA